MSTQNRTAEYVKKRSVPESMLGKHINSYDFIASELSEAYQNQLLSALTRNTPVIDELEFEDEIRYDVDISEDYRRILFKALQTGVPLEQIPGFDNCARVAAVGIAKDFAQKPETETNLSKQLAPRERVFDRSKTAILVLYCAMVLVVVIALVLTIPGTAWEDGVKFNFNRGNGISLGQKEAFAYETGINCIATEAGLAQIELTPYTPPVNNDTNWFDKLCDWVSKIVGG